MIYTTLVEYIYIFLNREPYLLALGISRNKVATNFRVLFVNIFVTFAKRFSKSTIIYENNER